jgi:hypothetical protein
MLNIREILDRNATTFIENVRRNISANDKYVTGQASNSLREESTEQGVTVFGVSYFETLETGIPPRSLVDGRDILAWGRARGILTNSKEDVFVAMRMARKIIENGAVLFRRGGAENIYTNEIDPLVQNIANDLGKAITDIQIVKG